MDTNTQKGCLIGCLSSVVIFVGTIFLFVVCCGLLMRGCIETSGEIGNRLAGRDEAEQQTAPENKNDFKRIWTSGDGDAAAPKILRIKLSGILVDTPERSWLNLEEDTSARAALRKIKAATKDKDIRGLWLDINTPGGGVSESDIIHAALLAFRTAESNRFVFVHMGGICCSGGYYVSAPADFIMAHPTTLTGSIGVIMNGVNASGLAKKIGIESVSIASSANKDLLNPLKDVNPEHVAILRRPINRMYERFLDIVAKGRKLPVDTLRPLADGSVFSAEDALKNRLIDGIGYEKDAYEQIKKMAGAKAVRIHRYEANSDIRRLFSSSFLFQRAGDAVRELKTAADESLSPCAEYRLR